LKRTRQRDKRCAVALPQQPGASHDVRLILDDGGALDASAGGDSF
jgi:hypothetical protein